MAKGTGITLPLPSGHSLEVSSAYRYVLAVDANAGSWVEGRAKAEGPIATRVRRFVAAGSWEFLRACYVFDTVTGKRVPAREWIEEASS